MNLFLATLLSALVSQSLCNPVRPKAYLQKRDLGHIESIGIPFPHLVRHISDNFPDHNVVAEHKTDPTTNQTLVRYDIPDDMWNSAIKSFPLHKRQANLARRSLLPPPEGTQGPAAKLTKRVGVTAYRTIRECNGEKHTVMTNERFHAATQFYCSNFDDYIKIWMESGGPSPPGNTLFGPWSTGFDSKTDIYWAFYRDASFPWDKIFLMCRDMIGSLENCRPEGSAGGKAGFDSKLGEGRVTWEVQPNPRFLREPFVI
ncbi:hypothetical protein ABW19_dt0206138 [Dactylella cylindrospora]|nr:hypothetical protein ABW19_dt0206138 [Dactylella cylindrospora]